MLLDVHSWCQLAPQLDRKGVEWDGGLCLPTAAEAQREFRAQGVVCGKRRLLSRNASFNQEAKEEVKEDVKEEVVEEEFIQNRAHTLLCVCDNRTYTGDCRA